MTAVYGITLLVGAVILLLWIATTAVSHAVHGWDALDPEDRFGRNGRFVSAGVFGFGMAGMSATYGGWMPILAFVGALVGAVALAAVSVWLGREKGT